MKEIWKDIPIKPFNKCYQISNLGRVKSKTRNIIRSDNYPHHYRGKLLKTFLNRDGYVRLELHYHNRHKNIEVHELVAKAFIPNSHHYPVVNHKDENKQNNNVNNLEWCTVKYNDNYGTKKERQRYHEYRKMRLTNLLTNQSKTFHSALDAAKHIKRKYPIKAKPLSVYRTLKKDEYTNQIYHIPVYFVEGVKSNG